MSKSNYAKFIIVLLVVILMSIFVLGSHFFLSYYYIKKAEWYVSNNSLLKAERSLAKLYKLRPNSVLTFRTLSDFYLFNKRNYCLASIYLEELLEAAYRRDDHLNYCFSLHNCGRLDDANKCYLEYIANYPNDNEALFYYGMLHYDKEDYKSAEKYVEMAYSIEKECHYTAYLVELNLVMGKDKAAKSYCKELKRCNRFTIYENPLEEEVYELCDIPPPSSYDEDEYMKLLPFKPGEQP